MQQQGNSANDLGRNQIGQNAPNKSSRANVVPVNNKNKKTILKKYIIIAASIFAVACLLVFSPYLFNSFKGHQWGARRTRQRFISWVRFSFWNCRFPSGNKKGI